MGLADGKNPAVGAAAVSTGCNLTTASAIFAGRMTTSAVAAVAGRR